MDLYRVLRPLLLTLHPDTAHDLSLWAFRRRFWSHLSLRWTHRLDLRTEVGGLPLDNPLGLAAGFDKNGEITSAMAHLGFGFLVTGSIRAGPHPGNPRPWFVRRLREDGLVNSMGLPSRGVHYVRPRLVEAGVPIPLLLSLVGETAADLMSAHDGLQGVGAGWEVNLSCPNTETGRTFEENLEAYGELLEVFADTPDPIFLKLSPYVDEAGRERALELAGLAIRRGLTRFTLCNTLPVEEGRVGVGVGGLSGRPLFPHTLQAVRDFTEQWGDDVELMGVGGVQTGGKALQLLTAGARAIQVLTALVTRGPLVVRHILQELEVELHRRGFRSVEEAIGYSA